MRPPDPEPSTSERSTPSLSAFCLAAFVAYGSSSGATSSLAIRDRTLMFLYVTPCRTFSGRFLRSLTDTELRSGWPQNLTSVCGSSSKRSSRAFTLAEKSISGFPTPPATSGASCAPCPVYCCSEVAFSPLGFCTEDGFAVRDAESLSDEGEQESPEGS